MALSNYADLLAAVEVWGKRKDVKSLIPDFITICETEMYSNIDTSIRIRDMVSTSSGVTTTTDRFQALPTGFLSPRRYDFEISTQRPTIDYVTPAHMVIRDGTGVPSEYTVTDQIEYDIIPQEVYTTNLIYYGKLTALSSTNTTNAILTNYPNVYLYGALWALNQYAEDEQQEAKYRSLFVGAIQGANDTDAEGNTGVASRKSKRGRTP